MDFSNYMLDEKFRATVDLLVDKPLDQIWSDVQELDLSYTQLKDISQLAVLKNLQQLSLAATQVQDISPLVGLKNLRVLDLSHTPLKDISLLAELENLNYLFLFGSQVFDIGPLDGLKNLQWVEPSGLVDLVSAPTNTSHVDLSLSDSHRYIKNEDYFVLGSISLVNLSDST